MPLVGVESEDIDRFAEFLERLGLIPSRYYRVVIKTKRGEKKFVLADVTGSVKGLATRISVEFGVAGLEVGPHLRWGEPNAGIWEDVAKIVYPDGDYELVPIYTNDSYLGLRLASDRVSGLESTIYISGVRFRLPLGLDDFVMALKMDKEEKLKRAAQAYGLERIVSGEVIKFMEELKKKRGAGGKGRG